MDTCNHPRIRFLGRQFFPGGEELRLFNCEICHTTVSRKGNRMEQDEIEALKAAADEMRERLLGPVEGWKRGDGFEELERLINEVSIAMTLAHVEE